MADTKQRRVLVTGATGFVGRHLADELRKRGMQVIGAHHRRPPPAGLHGIEWKQCASLGPDTDWSDALAGVDTVVHTAAKVHVAKGSKVTAAEIDAVNVDGTLRLARDAIRCGARRFVFLSSISVYGCDSSEMPLTEATPARPANDYARSKKRAEEGLATLAGSIGIVVVRPPLVYGPDAPGNFGRLVRLVESRLPLPFSNANRPRSMVSVRNLSSFLARCIESEAATGETFLVADGEDLAVSEVIRLIAAGLGRRATLFPVPFGPTRLAARLAGIGDIFDKLYGELRLDTGKARRVLQWSAPSSARDGVLDAVLSGGRPHA